MFMSELESGQKFTTPTGVVCVYKKNMHGFWCTDNPIKEWLEWTWPVDVEVTLGWPDDFVDPGDHMRNLIKEFDERKVPINSLNHGDKFTDCIQFACIVVGPDPRSPEFYVIVEKAKREKTFKLSIIHHNVKVKPCWPDWCKE